MKLLTFYEFLNEKNTKYYTGQEVLDYFNTLKSENHSVYDDPMKTDEIRNQILSNNYILKDINISELISRDINLKDYVENEDVIQHYSKKPKRVVDKFVLIGDSDYQKNILLDGYHRVLQSIFNNETSIKGFVPIL